MSDEFLRIARQEIQCEIYSLQDIFQVCTDDMQFYEKSRDIGKHLHKIKGLAPMIEQEKIGEIARISDIIVKYVIDHGALKDSQNIVFDAVQMMYRLFSEQTNNEIEDFKKQVKKTYPQISGV